MRQLGILLCILSVGSLPEFAQTAGSLTGQILDASQAAVPNASITALDPDKGLRREAKADNSGRYTIPNLPIGRYDVTVTHPGFETAVEKSVLLQVGANTTVDFVLRPGTISQVVDVTGEAPIIDPNQGQGATFSTRDLVELPINGRDYARFSLLAPGAVARSNYIADLSFNGLHSVHNQFAIDGVDASRVDQPYMSNGFERGARLLTGSLETIAEFRAQTANYRAEYGRAAGSYVNIVSKSGTNQLHGEVFEFFRNNFLDARNFFNMKPNPQAEYRFNDFGGNISGPIVKNRTFYFVNYEGSRQRIGITGSGTTPSALLRSQVLGTSPALALLVAQFPLGTSHTSNPLVDNYITVGVSQVREDTGSVRLDHSFNQKNSLYARVNVNDSHVFGPLFGVTSSALGLSDFQNVPIRTSNATVHDTHLFSPVFLNEFEIGMQRWGSHIISDEPYPNFSVTGLTISPGTRGRTKSNNTSYQIGDAMSYTRGAHSLKWGVTEYRIQIDRNSITTSTLTYVSLQDFINNSVSSASVTVGNPGSATWGYETGAFVQDTWQTRPGLTIDYGLRYDFGTAPFDPAHHAQTFDTRTLTLAPPGTPYFHKNTKDFGPRLAVAWQAAKNTVIRTGYGIFFQDYPVGFGSYSVPTNNLAGNTTLLRQQIPNLSYPLTPFLSQGTAPLPTVAGFNWNKPDIYAQQWNFTVERQFGETNALTLAYVGNHGLNLRRNEDINFFDPTLGRRPIPGFADVNIETASGQSVYHALQASFTQRMRWGLMGSFNYTWAHAIDDVQDQGLFSAQPQDNNNYHAERGNSSGDIRHNVSYQLLYNLPFGRSQHFLSAATGVTDKLVSGWQLASLAIFHTGIADTVYIGSNTYGNGNFTNQRPNAVAGVSQYAANQTINNWLNPAAFSLPAAGTFGNLGRNTVFGPGFAQADLSLLKETRFTESSHLEFRAEFYNVVNHPNFAEPNTTFGTTAFGKVLSTFGSTLGIGTARQIQLAMKLYF
jgi:hypothetical protein